MNKELICYIIFFICAIIVGYYFNYKTIEGMKVISENMQKMFMINMVCKWIKKINV